MGAAHFDLFIGSIITVCSELCIVSNIFFSLHFWVRFLCMRCAICTFLVSVLCTAFCSLSCWQFWYAYVGPASPSTFCWLSPFFFFFYNKFVFIVVVTYSIDQPLSLHFFSFVSYSPVLISFFFFTGLNIFILCILILNEQNFHLAATLIFIWLTSHLLSLA